MFSRIAKGLRMTQPTPNNPGMLYAHGKTVPIDATAGYLPGCIFQHIDGSAGGVFYINEGSVTSCDFNAVGTPEQQALSEMSDVGALAYTAGSLLLADGDSYEEVVNIDLSLTGRLRLGTFATGASTTTAVDLADITRDIYTDGQVDAVGLFGGTDGDIGSGYSTKVLRARHVINADDATVAQETYGGVGQLVVKDATLSHLHSGLMGTFEGHTSGVVLNSGYAVGHAGIIARVGGHASITATTPLAGFLAFNNATAELAGGLQVAYASAAKSATYTWDAMLYLSACDNLAYFPSATAYEAGIKSSAATPTGNTTHAIRVSIAGTPGYIPVYDDEAFNSGD